MTRLTRCLECGQGKPCRGYAWADSVGGSSISHYSLACDETIEDWLDEELRLIEE